MAENALTGRSIGVRVDESTNCRIVISGLEIIEPGLYFLVGAMRPFLITFPTVSNHADPLLNYTKNHAKSQHDLNEKLKLPPQLRGGSAK